MRAQKLVLVVPDTYLKVNQSNFHNLLQEPHYIRCITLHYTISHCRSRTTSVASNRTMQSHRFSLTRSLLNTRWAFEQLMMITMIRKALIEWCFGVVLCCVVVLCSPWSEACWTPGEILTSWLSRWSEKHWSSDVYVTSGYHMVVTGDLQFWAADDDDDQKSIDEVMFTWSGNWWWHYYSFSGGLLGSPWECESEASRLCLQTRVLQIPQKVTIMIVGRQSLHKITVGFMSTTL